jgi:hypothetical protein
VEIGCLPPLDTSALEFDVDHEIRLTLVDLMRGAAPNTVLGLVLANSDGIGISEIATCLDVDEALVSWSIDKLADDDLCVRVEIDGSTVAVPLAAYTSRNE